MGGSLNDADEIKRHPFFEDVDWNFVQEKAYQPPFRPKLNGKKDVANFDNVFFFFIYFVIIYNFVIIYILY